MGRLSRSAFLQGAVSSGVVAAGAGFFASPRRSSAAVARLRPPDFFGIVTGFDGENLAVRPPHTPATANACWQIEAVSGSVVWRLRDAEPGAFQPGEQVVAFGEWHDEVLFYATEMSSPLDAFDGTVTALTSTTIETDSGLLDLAETDLTRIEQVQPGERVSAAVLRNLDLDTNLVFWVGPQDAAA